MSVSKPKAILFSLFATLLLTDSAYSEQLVREFSGSRSSDTREFEVKSPWILDWRTATDYPGEMAVDISLVEAGTGAFEGSVLKTKWPGNGVRLFESSGRFQFKVISNLSRWNLKVVQLTPDEAEQYKPKDRRQQ